MNSKPFLLAIDQGTSSTRTILFSAQGEIVGVRQKELTLHYPQKGWVEQIPLDIWNDTLEVCRGIVQDYPDESSRTAGIGITNQRETTILWDRNTGDPIYNAIVWQDRRTADHCTWLKNEGYEELVASKTGLLLDPYFSGTKIAWILDHVEGARARAEKGDLAFGTVDSYLLWKLTGGNVHATDITNASRTMLFNVAEQKWDQELLAMLNIPPSLLPSVKDNVGDYGTTEKNHLGRSFTIGGVAGDQQAALIGQACFQPGMVKSTYGTGCFALMNIGETFRRSTNRLITTIAYRIGSEICYAIEGSIFNAGTAVQWLRDNLGVIDTAADSEKLADSVQDSGGVYFVPAFTGLGAPYWQPNAKGAILGISRDTNAAHIIRAALEAQAFQTLDLMDAMEADGNKKAEVIRADGGLVANEFVCRFLADMLDRRVEVPKLTETTAYGAACLAGLYAGIYRGFDELASNWQMSRYYIPSMKAHTRDSLYSGWKEALGRIAEDRT